MYIVDGYHGFGDTIYHIPFIHHMARTGQVFIHTPFPEFFQFRNAFPLPVYTKLKLQAENIANTKCYSNKSPEGVKIVFNYNALIKEMSIIKAFERTVPLDNNIYFDFNPQFSQPAYDVLMRAKKKLCVVRLPSVRDEWATPSRCSCMRYFQRCINILKQDHYIVTVGDTGNKEELYEACPTGIDERLDIYPNNLKIWDTMYLISKADFVLSFPCNIIPICMLLRKRAFFIYGGYVRHAHLTDPRFHKLHYVEPDPMCNCVSAKHECIKDIDENRLLRELDNALCKS